MKEMNASSYARPSFSDTSRLGIHQSMDAGALQKSTSVNTSKGIAASEDSVVLLEDSSSPQGAGAVLMSRPELAGPALARMDEKGYATLNQGVDALANGSDNLPPLDVTLGQALASMLKSGLNQKKGLFEETQSQRITLANTFALKEEALKSQAIFQFNQGMNKGSMGIISGSNAVATEIIMAVLTIVTAGAAAPATAAATTAGKAMAELGTQTASKTAAELAKGGVKAGGEAAVRAGVQTEAKSLGKHTLSEAETTDIAKSVMSSVQQIAFQGSKTALTQTLIANYSAPIKEKIINLIKEKLPQKLKDRLANDAQKTAEKVEVKTQAKLETQAQRAAAGPRSTSQKLSDAATDTAKSLGARIKDWGRLDTNEILNGVVDYGVNYAIRQGVDELTESRDPSKNIQTMYGNLAETEKKVAEVLGRTADAASDGLQKTQTDIDQVRQTITDTQQTFQQMMAAEAQSEKRIAQAI